MRNEKQQNDGWTNFETWAISSWLNKNETTRERWANTARQCVTNAHTSTKFKTGVWTLEEARTYSLSDLLEEEFRLQCPLEEACPYRTLLMSAMGYVNWDEVADRLLYDARMHTDE